MTDQQTLGIGGGKKAVITNTTERRNTSIQIPTRQLGYWGRLTNLLTRLINKEISCIGRLKITIQV